MSATTLSSTKEREKKRLGHYTHDNNIVACVPIIVGSVFSQVTGGAASVFSDVTSGAGEFLIFHTWGVLSN